MCIIYFYNKINKTEAAYIKMASTAESVKHENSGSVPFDKSTWCGRKAPPLKNGNSEG